MPTPPHYRSGGLIKDPPHLHYLFLCYLRHVVMASLGQESASFDSVSDVLQLRSGQQVSGIKAHSYIACVSDLGSLGDRAIDKSICRSVDSFSPLVQCPNLSVSGLPAASAGAATERPKQAFVGIAMVLDRLNHVDVKSAMMVSHVRSLQWIACNWPGGAQTSPGLLKYSTGEAWA